MADLGEAEGAAATPFSLKFCLIVIEFSEKIKSVYVADKWASVATTFKIFWIRPCYIYVYALAFHQWQL